MVHATQGEEARPFDMGWVAEFVDELSGFDRLMNKAVTDSGILKHVPRFVLAREGALAGQSGSSPRYCSNYPEHVHHSKAARTMEALVNGGLDHLLTPVCQHVSSC